MGSGTLEVPIVIQFPEQKLEGLQICKRISFIVLQKCPLHRCSVVSSPQRSVAYPLVLQAVYSALNPPHLEMFSRWQNKVLVIRYTDKDRQQPHRRSSHISAW